MRISDLIRIKPPTEPVDLVRLHDLREALDREGDHLSLMTRAAVAEIVEEYITPLDPADDPLYRLLGSVTSNGGKGAGFLVRGASGSGKTHLLAVATLLLGNPPVRPFFEAKHEHYQRLMRELATHSQILVVPIPLEEHRASDEHLEDIFFDRTEQELRRSRHGIELALSETSHALELIERHIVPRYGAELDAHVAQLPGTHRSWRHLRDKNPAAAVAAARAFAQEIGYPLDFRQSRVERLARLLDVVQSRKFAAVVWLTDNLGEFLAATGQKAVRNDAAFLEFLGQRSRIAPLYVVATMEAGTDRSPAIEPYMAANIQECFEVVNQSVSEMRRVALYRSLQTVDDEQLKTAFGDVEQAYREHFSDPGFTAAELALTYPLHPVALTCLEVVYARFFGEADALAGLLESLVLAGGQAPVLQRDVRRLLTLDDLWAHLANRLSAHPQAAPYLQEALPYFERSGAQLYPRDPDLPLLLARCLAVLRLANMSVPIGSLTPLIGLDETGEVRVPSEVLRECLEQMRLRGRYVDARRGDTPENDLYTIDAEANYTDVARRQLLSCKASLAEDDPRLWEAATAAATGASLPLAELIESRVLAVEWANTSRRVAVQALDVAALSADRPAARSSDLADSATVEDVLLYIGSIVRPEVQRTAWQSAITALPRTRWSSAVAAWLPRTLAEDELDRLKEFAACRIMLQSTSVQAEPRVADRLAEEAVILGNEVRAIVEKAYLEGEVLSADGTVASHADLQQVRGNWPATLATVCGRLLARVFPEFVPLAPRMALTSREPVDRLIRRIVSTESDEWDSEDPDGELFAAVLVPLRLVRQTENGWRMTVETSPAAQLIMERVRRRDQSPETVPGRPVEFKPLQRYLAKSALGLPENLAEIVVATMIRSGLLLPLDNRQEVVRRARLAPPLHEGIACVARAPMLDTEGWQQLSRLARVVLERMIPRPDHALQAELWETIIKKRHEAKRETERLRKVLDALCERLEQPAEAWFETASALARLDALWEAVDPELYPAEGLGRLLAEAGPLLHGTPMPLTGLLRHAQALDDFLEHTAPDVVTLRDYLQDPDLNIPEGDDLQVRRRQLLQLISRGEVLLSEENTFRRLVQIFLSVYKRRYTTWHTRCYRSAVFDRYRSLRSSPEIRALALLQQLQLKIETASPGALELLEAQEAKRCMFSGLSHSLEQQPTCPQCRLPLDREVQLVPLETVREMAEAEISRYVSRLRRPAFLEALREYMAALPARGETALRLENLLEMSENPPARVLLGILTDDVIMHLNRVLSGKTIRPLDLGHLQQALAGRTLSKKEAQQLFRKWLDESANDENENGDTIIHIEP